MDPIRYEWSHNCTSANTELWPLLAQTSKFNRMSQLPSIARNGWEKDTLLQRISFKKYGISAQWLEEPFSWVKNHFFGVRRHFRNSPIKELRVRMPLSPRESDPGTQLSYQLEITPRNILALLSIPFEASLVQKPALLKQTNLKL